MWSDNEAKVDLINVIDKVDVVNELINNDDLLPMTIGVFGDWGSGKSTLMNLVHQSIKSQSNDKVITLEFNGWVFEDYDDAKSALMGRIIDEIIDQKKVTDKTKQIISKLLKRINWFRLVGLAGKNILTMSITGATSPNVLEDLNNSFDAENIQEVLDDPEKESLRKSISEFRDDFAQLLNTYEISRLVVFIDDLDRCLPNTILEVFEAIRLFLFVPNTVFLIGADERIVESSIKTKFPRTNTEFDIGRNYLEKIIQFPIKIPPMSSRETETYVNLLFSKLHLGNEEFLDLCQKVLDYEPETIFDLGFNIHNVNQFLKDPSDKLKEDLYLSRQISKVLATGLQGNPRQIKRFLNTLLIRMKMANSKKIALSKKVLIKLMILEYFEPSFYKKLEGWQSRQNGCPEQLGRLENDKADTEKEDSEEDDEQIKYSDEEKNWLKNSFTKDWLGLEPELSGVDLRPYYYFSREEEGIYSSIKSRLSPEGKRILELLFSKSDAETLAGVKQAENLGNNELKVIFNEVLEKIFRSENKKEVDAYLKLAAKLCEKYSKLFPDLLNVLDKLSPQKVSMGSPQILFNLSQGISDHTDLKALINKWAENDSNKKLQQVAAQIETQLK